MSTNQGPRDEGPDSEALVALDIGYVAAGEDGEVGAVLLFGHL